MYLEVVLFDVSVVDLAVLLVLTCRLPEGEGILLLRTIKLASRRRQVTGYGDNRGWCTVRGLEKGRFGGEVQEPVLIMKS